MASGPRSATSPLFHPPSSLIMAEIGSEIGSHTKSLMPFQKILESSEAEYRDTPIGNRDAIIEGIIEDIRSAAAKKKIVVANDGTL